MLETMLHYVIPGAIRKLECCCFIYMYLLCIYLAGSNPGEFIYICFHMIIPGASNVYVFGSQLPVNSQPAPRFLYIISM